MFCFGSSLYYLSNSIRSIELQQFWFSVGGKSVDVTYFCVPPEDDNGLGLNLLLFVLQNLPDNTCKVCQMRYLHLTVDCDLLV